MTVKDLKEKIEGLPDDMVVCYYNGNPLKEDEEYDLFVEFDDWGNDFSLEEIEKIKVFENVKYIDEDINFKKSTVLGLITH